MPIPKKIYEDFKNKNIDKQSAFDLLSSLLESNDEENIRLDSIKTLEKIGLFNQKFFNLIENMLISDSNVKIRSKAAQLIKNYFLDRALDPLKWALRNETQYECLVIVIQSLAEIRNNESKLILYNETRNLMKIKYINKNRRIENKKFKRTLKKIVGSKKYENLTHQALSEILINYLTIHHLSEQYSNVYYELGMQDGLVEELDLSDYLEYEVKGTPFGWKNNLTSLAEISCIKYLKRLKKIDLSNNHVEDIKELTQLQDITHLMLANNEINEIINLKYLKSFHNLQYIDLRGNDIAKKLEPSDFDLNTRVILNDSYIKIK